MTGWSLALFCACFARCRRSRAAAAGDRPTPGLLPPHPPPQERLVSVAGVKQKREYRAMLDEALGAVVSA